MRTPRTRIVACLLATTIVAVSCSAIDEADEAVNSSVEQGAEELLDEDDAVDCSEEALSGGDEGFAFTSAHPVVDGRLGEVCFGARDPLLIGAWNDLAAITPPGQLTDLALFAGFEPDGDAEADTLAFVNALDADGSRFQMTVNVPEAEADADARCAADDGFFGSYAATSPEEDFAEAFSAYVFRLMPDNRAQQDRLDWIDARPGLAEFRGRADAAGLTPLANTFDLCG